MKKNKYSIIQSFLDRVNFCPEDLALVSNNIKYSYKDIFLRAHFFKNKFISEKYKNKKIGILCKRTVFDIIAIVAILLSGNTYVPFNSKHPKKRILEIANKNGINKIFSDEIYKDHSEVKLEKKISNKSFNNLLKKIDFNKKIYTQDAYVIFTSGSTGLPKGVKISHKNVLTFVKECKKILKIGKEKNFILIPDLSFDLSIFPLWYCFETGGTLFYPSTREKLNLVHYIKEKKINIFCSTPSLIDYLNNLNLLKNRSFNSIKTSVFCGEPFFVKQFNYWNKVCKNSKIFNTYGPTEATCFCSYYQCNKKNLKDVSENSSISIGKFFKNIKYQLVADEKICQEQGHLLLSGDQVFSGYLNKQKFSPKSFEKIKNFFFYKTGDYIKKYKNNYFFSKRIDRQIKIGGFRVELKEIENLLNKYTKKNNFVFYSNKIKKIVAVSQKNNKTLNNIKKYLSEHLPEYMRPKKLILIKSFPLTSNEKNDYKKIIYKYGRY